MLKVIFKDSFVVQAGSYVLELINKSYCFRWLVGAGQFEEMFYYRHAKIYQIGARVGRVLMSPLLAIGRLIRTTTEQSTAKSYSQTLWADFLHRPLSLFALTGISLILTNTLARVLFFNGPSIRGWLIRLALILALSAVVTSKISWQRLTDSSWTFQTIKHIFID